MLPEGKWKDIPKASNREEPRKILLAAFQGIDPEATRILMEAFDEGSCAIAPMLGMAATLASDIRGFAGKEAVRLQPGQSLSQTLISEPGFAQRVVKFAEERVEELRQPKRKRKGGDQTEPQTQTAAHAA